MSERTSINMDNLILTTRGMMERLDREPIKYEDWLAFGKKLFQLKQAIQWAIGDWINYGEAHYGEKYAQALDITEYSYGTLANYAYVARAFDSSRRRENLSWSHHAAVRGIEDESEQDALLDIAESQQMGRDELRDIVKKYKNPDGLLVVESPYRVIHGRIAYGERDLIFYPDDDNDPIVSGRVILHLYEDEESE